MRQRALAGDLREQRARFAERFARERLRLGKDGVPLRERHAAHLVSSRGLRGFNDRAEGNDALRQHEQVVEVARLNGGAIEELVLLGAELLDGVELAHRQRRGAVGK